MELCGPSVMRLNFKNNSALMSSLTVVLALTFFSYSKSRSRSWMYCCIGSCGRLHTPELQKTVSNISADRTGRSLLTMASRARKIFRTPAGDAFLHSGSVEVMSRHAGCPAQPRTPRLNTAP